QGPPGTALAEARRSPKGPGERTLSPVERTHPLTRGALAARNAALPSPGPARGTPSRTISDAHVRGETRRGSRDPQVVRGRRREPATGPTGFQDRDRAAGQAQAHVHAARRYR